MKIYPSLISADILALRDTLVTLNNLCEGYHLDVMDDHFVPNLTWGPAFINAIAKETTLPLQIHLMVDDPHAWLSRLHLSSKDTFIFHYEVVADLEIAYNLIEEIKEQGVRAGIAINPETAVNSVANLLPMLNEILVMSVNPGFSGQAFIDVSDKVIQLKKNIQDAELSCVIAMDGGINKENITQLPSLGVDIVGVASAIFFQDNYTTALNELKMSIANL